MSIDFSGMPYGSGVGGIDEAGRGPLAGPVIAAVVVLRPGHSIDGVRDSKKLTAQRRNEMVAKIRKEALAWSIGRAAVSEIDRLNILQATLVAMQRAVRRLSVLPPLLRIDGNRAPRFDGYLGRVETLVRGDDLCIAIGAASILAKVTRDREMCALHERYPEYGFVRHKGYGTREHCAALRLHGPCPAHRQSFRPVREASAARAV